MVVQGLIDSTKSYATVEKQDELAFHGFAFFIRGLTPNLKFSFSYFATRDAAGVQLLSIFWEVVFILKKKTCNLWVIAATSDGASTNRRFCQMHKDTDGNSQIFVIEQLICMEKTIYLFC